MKGPESKPNVSLDAESLLKELSEIRKRVIDIEGKIMEAQDMEEIKRLQEEKRNKELERAQILNKLKV